MISLASFIVVTPQVASIDVAGLAEPVVGWGFIGIGYMDAKGLFTGSNCGLYRNHHLCKTDE
ncbi:hypothetical protein MX850_02010 [Erysipelothrix sp. Poltava]|nr:hypothetical protein MX850_02010 [Erysipelothrix sp. Poltava]